MLKNGWYHYHPFTTHFVQLKSDETLNLPGIIVWVIFSLER